VLRLVELEDVSRIQQLITRSARGLSEGFYTTEQVEACIAEVYGVDTQLIADRTYYVVEIDGEPAAAGGWSKRATLYGGDQAKSGVDPLLDPRTDAARIRAFFVHPRFARRGLARQLYERCSRAAYDAGFRELELMTTLPGVPLYEALGFAAGPDQIVTLRGGVEVRFVRMRRSIAQPETPGEGLTQG
jgi:GNAT superfamily N-acetyltransferase